MRRGDRDGIVGSHMTEVTLKSRSGRSFFAASAALLAPGGVGLVKLMGRHSGFIACYASLVRSDADAVLIPEVPF